MRRVASAAALLGILALSCATSTDPNTSESSPPPTTTGSGFSSAELVAAADSLIGFMKGDVDFDDLRISKSVDLHLSPEGGGNHVTVARSRLADRDSWKVRSKTLDMTYNFVPARELTELTTKVGRHLNCMEYSLSSRVKRLAAHPHVGASLAPRDADSCLQTWNVTFVFDPKVEPPTLVAAVYDQWEW